VNENRGPVLADHPLGGVWQVAAAAAVVRADLMAGALVGRGCPFSSDGLLDLLNELADQPAGVVKSWSGSSSGSGTVPT
jgi:hypothetical protein